MTRNRCTLVFLRKEKKGVKAKVLVSYGYDAGSSFGKSITRKQSLKKTFLLTVSFLFLFFFLYTFHIPMSTLYCLVAKFTFKVHRVSTSAFCLAYVTYGIFDESGLANKRTKKTAK